MGKHHTEETRLSFLEQYLSSGLSVNAFSSRIGVSSATLRYWLKRYGLPHTQKQLPTMSNPEKELARLRLKNEELKKENSSLKKKLNITQVNLKAHQKLIELAESTYHIGILKNSDAK